MAAFSKHLHLLLLILMALFAVIEAAPDRGYAIQAGLRGKNPSHHSKLTIRGEKSKSKPKKSKKPTSTPKKPTPNTKPVCRSYTETFQKAKIISEQDYNGKQSVDWIDLSNDPKTWKQSSKGLQINLFKPSKYVPLKGYNKYVG